MTVSNKVPLVEYTGNGTITKFDWDWDMIADSTINVLVDNYNVFDWTLQGQSVVFNTAPEDGAEIIIYRRTKIWMPENYRAFGRFNSEKTELSMDRAFLIAQERNGDATDNEPPNGIVGGANLSMTRGEFDLTVVSERGTDAVLPIWNPDDTEPTPPTPPDPTIIWEGSELYCNTFNENPSNCEVRFRMDFTGGGAAEASASYIVNNSTLYVGWLNADPSDNEYWMRVTQDGTALASEHYSINDGNNFRSSGDVFQMRSNTGNASLGPYVIVETFGDAPPTTRVGRFKIEISKDDGGIPDGNWAVRYVTLESLLKSVAPPPDPEIPPLPTGAIYWSDINYGYDFGDVNSMTTAWYIPAGGISVQFTTKTGLASFGAVFEWLEYGSERGPLRQAISETAFDMVGIINNTGPSNGIIGQFPTLLTADFLFEEGKTYYWNLRWDDDNPGNTWLRYNYATPYP